MRPRQGAVLRHGRHHRQDLPDRRRRAADSRAPSRSRGSYRFLKGSGLPLRIPVIEMVEIGAGGGSIAAVDPLQPHQCRPGERRRRARPRLLRPRRRRPTVTDADVRARAASIPATSPAARSSSRADKAGARRRQSVGTPLGLDAHRAAFGVSEIVEENMANAARVHAIERGKELAGPHHDRLRRRRAAPCRAAGREARHRPRHGAGGAGVGSAVGFLRAPVAYEVVRSRYVQLDQNFDPAASTSCSPRCAPRPRPW